METKSCSLVKLSEKEKTDKKKKKKEKWGGGISE